MFSQIEFQKNENFLITCNKKLKKSKNKNFSKKILPKISVISPVYNSAKFIIRFINCIEKQNFKDLEIIFIDDLSIDNSIKIIE